MISICMIVKNEEKILEKCLTHLVQLGYEIVIADTGSIDKTKEIALKYTDKVFDYIWEQDFAAARNFVISHADHEYVLVVDSDEIITLFNKSTLEQSIYTNPESVGRVLIINDYTRGNEVYCYRERVSRLFSKRLYQYEGIIHEQIVRKDKSENTFYDISIEMHHEGYEGDLCRRRDKTERNISLLKKQLQDNGNEPYILYQLGKSYYMQEDYQAACEWFGEAFCFDLNPSLEYVQDMVESYGYALLNSNQYDKAMQLLNVYDEFAENADFVFLVGLIYMNNAKFEASINEFLKAVTMEQCRMDGVNSYRAFYNIGVIYDCLGNTDQANEYYLKCGDYKPASIRASVRKK